jgi:hypothetical protein
VELRACSLSGERIVRHGISKACHTDHLAIPYFHLFKQVNRVWKSCKFTTHLASPVIHNSS